MEVCQLYSQVEGKCGRFENLQKVYLHKDQCEQNQYSKQFFASIFTDENINTITNPEICYVQSELTDLSITPETVKQSLVKLKENKACHTELIHPKILIDSQTELVLPLVGIFKQSLHDGRRPQVWKQANVCPIFKKVEPSRSR